MADLLVIDQPSAFNAVLGRPSLRELKAITSIHHPFMKFPTPRGVGEVKGDQQESRQCYHQVVRAASKPRQFNIVDQRSPSEGPLDDTLNLRPPDEEGTTGPIKDLVDLPVDHQEPSRVLKIEKDLPNGIREVIFDFLGQNLDVFAWAHSDMEGIDPSVMSHHLNVDPSRKPVRQKRRAMDTERYQALKEEVDKLLSNGFIKESFYPSWLANLVLVKKSNGKWRTCMDSFPLPRIDQLVDATSGHALLSFMDAYSGYNQIPMHVPDQEHTSFIKNHGLYCYKVMPFGLKNAGATYQHLANMMFKEQIGKTMEVYVDNMLVKSKTTVDHVAHLFNTFTVLRKYRMKLNPLKCVLGVASGKFLGFMVNHRGIEVNLEKIRALIDIWSPNKTNEVQSLTGRVAALSRFISRAIDKCLSLIH